MKYSHNTTLHNTTQLPQWVLHSHTFLGNTVKCLIPAASDRSDIAPLVCSSTVHLYYSQDWKWHLQWSLRNSYTPSHLKMNQKFYYIFLWFFFWLWSHVRLLFRQDPSVIAVSKTRWNWLYWRQLSCCAAIMIRTFCLLTMCLHLGHANWRKNEYRRGNVKTEMVACRKPKPWWPVEK